MSFADRTLAGCLLMAAVLLGTPNCAADEGSSAGPEERSVALKIGVPTTLQVGTLHVVTVSAEIKGDLTDGILRIVTGGVVSLADAASFQVDAASDGDYFPGLPSKHYKRDLGALKRDKHLKIAVPVRMQGSGYGYITALVVGQDESGERNVSIVTKYGASDGRRTHLSARGFIDAEAKLYRSWPGFSQEKERRVRILKRANAQTRIEMVPMPYSPEASVDAASLAGRISYTDHRGNQHPVRRIRVEAYEGAMGAETMLAHGRTDEAGQYNLQIPLAGRSYRDVFILAKAIGPTVQVVDSDIDPTTVPASRLQPWSIASAKVQVARFGASVKVDLTATNLIENNTAFEAYEAASFAADFVTKLTGKAPPLVSLNFPSPDNDDGSHYNLRVKTIFLAGTDAHDWDNIQHEYGHHVQHTFKFYDSPGKAHSSKTNLCRKRGKPKGIKLAWAEAWPTFFAVQLQAELGLKQLDIPGVGDTRYTDMSPAGKPLDYDLAHPGDHQYGEGNEAAIMRVLWDLYDKDKPESPDRVSYSAMHLWQTVTKDYPRSFSGWWQVFAAGKSARELGALGRVLATHGFASPLQAPKNDEVIASDVEFSWDRANGCADAEHRQGLYALRLYGSDLGRPLFTSPFTTERSLRMKIEELRQLAAGNEELFWSVLAKDDTPPETGEYHGPLRRFKLGAP